MAKFDVCYLCLEPFRDSSDVELSVPAMHLGLGWEKLPLDQLVPVHRKCNDDLLDYILVLIQTGQDDPSWFMDE